MFVNLFSNLLSTDANCLIIILSVHDTCQHSFSDRYVSKFVVKLLLNIPPHLDSVATLPCEIFLLTNCCV